MKIGNSNEDITKLMQSIVKAQRLSETIRKSFIIEGKIKYLEIQKNIEEHIGILIDEVNKLKGLDNQDKDSH